MQATSPPADPPPSPVEVEPRRVDCRHRHGGDVWEPGVGPADQLRDGKIPCRAMHGVMTKNGDNMGAG